MAQNKGLVLYDECAEYFNALPDADAANLIRCIFEYNATGETPQSLTPMASIAFIAIKKTIDRNTEKYEATCKARQSAAKKRWNDDTDVMQTDASTMQTNANAYFASQNDTDVMQTDADGCKLKTKNLKHKTNNVSSLTFGNNNTSFAIAHDVGDAACADAADDAVDAADLTDSAADNAVIDEAEDDVKAPAAHKETLQDKRFAEFWAAYPKKAAKQTARKAWNKIHPNARLFDAIMAGLRRAKVSEQWTKEHGQYIPNPATWLNGGRWEDDYSEIEQRGSSFVVDEFYELAVNRSGHDP